MRALPLALALACAGPPPQPADRPDDSGPATADTADGADGTDAPDLPDTDHCGSIADFVPIYDEQVARWQAQDAAAPLPEQPLVFTGSSSIRRWEGLQRAYADHRPLQRGMGGAQVAEIALWADPLVNAYAPRGVVVFAGTNDVAFGVAPDAVVARFRCLRERIWIAQGSALPVFFIGITPTPARWSGWAEADAVNRAVQDLAEGDPGLVYVDVPAAFLEQGSPPPDALFVSDGLHLSEAGYALWDAVLRAEVDAALAPWPAGAEGSGAPPPGARVRVDLGPDNPEDGEVTASPDHLGHHWNSWRGLEGGEAALAGEHLGPLVTTEGAETGLTLTLTGGFLSNGRVNGGLLWPDEARLGDLAVGSATGDFFYVQDEDQSGGLALRGLDPAARYTLRLFATRDAEEVRVTRFVVHGAETRSGSLQTSGAGAGADGATGNDDTVLTFDGLQPDPWGQLFVDVQLEAGAYAYLSLLELEAE